MQNKNEVEFCQYTDADFDGFVDCINDFYVGGYPYKQYLNKTYLKNLIDENRLIITLAKTADGKIVGTSAAQSLHGVFEGSVLLLLRCVLEDYRGNGIGSKQEFFLFDLIEKKFGNALSIYADVMTHDDFSQRTMCRQGFVLCGFRFMLYKSEIMVPKLNFDPEIKMTQAIYCRNKNIKSVEITAPPEHRDFIKNIYEQLNVECNFVDFTDAITDDVIKFKNNELHQNAEIFFKRSSNKICVDKSIENIDKLIDSNYTVVAYINMRDKNSLDVYNELIKHGFFFTGIKPLSKDGEYLVMSHIDNCKRDFSVISVTRENKKFLNYIIGGYNNEQ